MKFNFKTILGLNKREQQNSVEIDYSKYVDFYYKNLINSLILFSLTAKELEKLVARSFNPIFELESEIEYAYTPICFDAIFKKGLISVISTNLLSIDKFSYSISYTSLIDSKTSLYSIKLSYLIPSGNNSTL